MRNRYWPLHWVIAVLVAAVSLTAWVTYTLKAPVASSGPAFVVPTASTFGTTEPPSSEPASPAPATAASPSISWLHGPWPAAGSVQKQSVPMPSDPHCMPPPVQGSGANRTVDINALCPSGVWQNMGGAQATTWAIGYLNQLHAPTTDLNMKSMFDWFPNEGTPHDGNNPLNLCTRYGDSYIVNVVRHGKATGKSWDNDTVQTHIMTYQTPADSARAFAREMTTGGPDNGAYQYIVSGFRSGKGIEGNSPGLQYDLDQYSGSGYHSIRPN